MNFNVRIHVITFRRVHLLKRALDSIINQTYENWIAEIINDDPTDSRVEELIKSYNDARIMLSIPMIKRGGTESFNYAFRKIDEPFACILEDDNWYESTFLADMIQKFECYPECQFAVANERIWKELSENKWKFTNATIWNENENDELFEYKLEDKCGNAKICNSSMFWKTKNAYQWMTPKEIPIDVTEHFRERAIPHPILLVKKVLVNYSETMKSYRSNKNSEWGIYQVLLVSSVFIGLNSAEAKELALKLWKRVMMGDIFFTTILLNTALSHKEALVILHQAPLKEIIKYFLSLIFRYKDRIKCIKAKENRFESWNYLLEQSLVQKSRQTVCCHLQ